MKSQIRNFLLLAVVLAVAVGCNGSSSSKTTDDDVVVLQGSGSEN
jgi:hypothetical protein